MKKICKTCKFFRPLEYYIGDIGECIFNPPQVIIKNTQQIQDQRRSGISNHGEYYETKFPTVNENEHCGKHKTARKGFLKWLVSGINGEKPENKKAVRYPLRGGEAMKLKEVREIADIIENGKIANSSSMKIAHLIMFPIDYQGHATKNQEKEVRVIADIIHEGIDADEISLKIADQIMDYLESETKNQGTAEAGAAKASPGYGVPRIKHTDIPPMPAVKPPREEVSRLDIDPDPELVKAIAEKIIAVIEREKGSDRVRIEIKEHSTGPSPFCSVKELRMIPSVIIEGKALDVSKVALTLGFDFRSDLFVEKEQINSESV